jgi:hypothetical protein
MKVELEFSDEWFKQAERLLVQVNQARERSKSPKLDMQQWLKLIITSAMAQDLANLEASRRGSA